MKLVKVQLIEMYENGELECEDDMNSRQGLNDYDEVLAKKNQQLIDEINQDIERANAMSHS